MTRRPQFFRRPEPQRPSQAVPPRQRQVEPIPDCAKCGARGDGSFGEPDGRFYCHKCWRVMRARAG